MHTTTAKISTTTPTQTKTPATTPTSTTCTLASFYPLEHGSILKHVWKDKETDLAATDVCVL